MDVRQREQLEQDGYVLLEAVLTEAEVGRLLDRLEELWAMEGERAGEENYIEHNARRLANLVNKGDIFLPVLRHPSVLEAVRVVLGPQVRLSMMNAHDALPQTTAPSRAARERGRGKVVTTSSDTIQPLHSDADHGGKPDEQGYYACTSIWMLDDFTHQNGATRLVPGTHRSSKLPKEAMADANAPHPDEVIVEGRAGDVLVFNGHCWHGGRANRTSSHRRAILTHYIRADHPQRLVQTEALAREVQERMDLWERELLGLED